MAGSQMKLVIQVNLKITLQKTCGGIIYQRNNNRTKNYVFKRITVTTQSCTHDFLGGYQVYLLRSDSFDKAAVRIVLNHQLVECSKL